MSFDRSYFSRFRLVAVLAALFLLAGTPAGHANPLSQKNDYSAAPVNFTAQSLLHDDEKQTVTAIGDVEMVQEAQILRADAVIYDLAQDRVTAIGNVSLLDEEGNLHFADYVELHNHMKEGLVQKLLTLLADGSRFTAEEAKRENNGIKTTMTNATYTVCKVCEMDPHPLWQIKASKVVHDADKKTVRYKDARLELLGVPMIYSPIFSHPDPTLKRKSGFLRPQYGWSKALGTHIRGGYYYDIAPDKDMTLQVEPTTLAGILTEGEWRQRFKNGQLKINASTANSSRKEEDGRVEDDKQRGHVTANGKFDINDKWRSGFDLARTTDKQYLRLYDISKENVLTNQVYAERFYGRDYSRISAFNFQDLRLGIRPDQPDIVPMAEHYMIGEPQSLWGGRWQAGISALGLNRQNDNQSMQRGSVDAGWERRGISSWGMETLLHLDGRGDFYAVENSDAALVNPALDRSPKTARGMATANLTSSYPLVKTVASRQAIIEPVAGISFSPNVSHTNDKIPNEDSIDTNFDSNNLFQQSRYPGIDRQEDGGRMNYGLKTGLYGDNGRYGKVFIGQSYRFSGDRTFPQGSGLEDRLSDVVGQVQAGLSDYLDADYRFRLDNQTLAARHHEIIAGGGNNKFRLNSRYFYTAGVAGTGFDEARQQIQMDGTYNITETWKFKAAGLVDIGNQPGLRNATTGFNYVDECFTFSVEGSRNVANEASGDNETKLLLRIGFKNIGEFSGPQISLGGNQVKK
ncbi:MAG: LPS assembly protein LptD [Alphaproteobacteria bacterium]|nr:LPS assembly protein LptD [Alphaproteobacteria bacterium]